MRSAPDIFPAALIATKNQLQHNTDPYEKVPKNPRNNLIYVYIFRAKKLDRLGVISNTDFADENGNWIYDSTPTDGIDCTITLYAKWTRIPALTNITLDACGFGDDGLAVAEYQKNALVAGTFTSVTNTSPTTHVLGYFTRPEGHGGEMILTSMGDFTTSTAIYNDKTGDEYLKVISDKGIWNLYNKDNPYNSLEIILYAHYVVDVDVSAGSTDVTIDYTCNGKYGTFKGASFQGLAVAYGTTKLDLTVPESNLGYMLYGLYTTEAGTEETRVASADGVILTSHDVSGYTKEAFRVDFAILFP